MKKTHVFLSYRNIMRDGQYVNYEILKKLISQLSEKNPGYIFDKLAPEVIPRGSLFSSYDVADFLHKTMLILDDCNEFYILDNEYLNSEGYFSSIWTEAEAYIWGFYDRDMFLSPHKNKEKFYNFVHYENNEFIYSKKPLLKLTPYHINLLQIASSDFDKTKYPGRPDYSSAYLKNSKIYFIVCDNCKKMYITEKIKRKSKEYFQRTFICPHCENRLVLNFNGKYLVCEQEKHSNMINELSIFDTLELLFGNKNKYPIMKF